MRYSPTLLRVYGERDALAGHEFIGRVLGLLGGGRVLGLLGGGRALSAALVELALEVAYLGEVAIVGSVGV
tara:strand:- start:264 stop:476 length:213 start_codon:yes stop_codon:yes gene_type:complete